MTRVAVVALWTILLGLVVCLGSGGWALAKGPTFDELSPGDVLSGRFRGAEHPDFVKSGGSYLRRDVWYRYKALKKCALNPKCSGLKRPMRIVTCSKFRRYHFQKQRWLGEMRQRRAIVPAWGERVDNVLRYLALPGTSRHHWGTDIDMSWNRRCMMSNHQYMSAPENERRCKRYETRCLAKRVPAAKAKCDGGDCKRPLEKVDRLCHRRYTTCFRRKGKAVSFYSWLRDNAGRFGFCQPYKGAPEDRHRALYTRGYEQERWHWSSCCEAKRNYERIAKDLVAAVPPPEDVFGREALRSKRLGPTLRALHKTLVVDAARQHILNVHKDCLSCAVDCSKEPVAP